MGALSGRLTLTQGRAARRLDFIDGRVTFVSSSLPVERLATWLSSTGVLPDATLRRLLGQSLLGRTLFTSLLAEERAVDEGALRQSLTHLGERIIGRLLLARGVEFVFDPAYPVKDLLNLSLDVDPQSLLLEAARQSDELILDQGGPVEDSLPHSGEAFERFFWSLIREGIAGDELIDGEQVIALHQLVRDIMRTLAQWLASSPGLVPLPAAQADRIAAALGDDAGVDLAGNPHAAWNQMVLHFALRGREPLPVGSLAALAERAADLRLWPEMIGGERWRRPDAGRLDSLTSEAVARWAAAARTAAPMLGADPEQAALAAHLVVVPCDLVLWVLATLPVPHHRLRATLLRELPRRLGAELAAVADLPEEITSLFSCREPSPLHVALSLARRALPSAQLWLDPLAGKDDLLFAVASAQTIAAAVAAIDDALPGR